MKNRSLAIVAPLAALAVVAAACGSSSAKTATTNVASTAAVTTAAVTATTAGASVTTAAGTTTATTAKAVSLKAAGCPDPLVVQTDWFPEADHGWTYELVGQGGTEDSKAGKYSGKVGDITVEIRSGGPFVNFSSPAAQMYSATDVFMAYVDTGDAIRNATKQPVVAVFTSYDVGPQIIQWDPAQFPNVKSIADVGKTAGDGKILVFGGAAYTDYLVGKGILKKSQVDATYDGSPKRFTSEKGLFQQGFATNEPYSYENLITDWKKPVSFDLVHNSGFAIYQSALSVKPETVKAKADCLKAIVPMFQKALVSYVKSPAATNTKLTSIVTNMKQFWQINDALSNDAVKKMKDLKLVSDAGNGYVGDMDCTRVQKLIDEFNPIEKANNVEGVKDGLKCAEIVDNSFLDKTISLGF